MTLQFTDKTLLRNNFLIMTYRGKDAAGNAFFAYLRCNDDGVALLRRDYADAIHRTLETYGEVLYTDSLANPDAKAQTFLAEYVGHSGGSLL